MRKVFVLLICIPLFSIAQKKPLDHTVYDGWQNVGERAVSNNGEWVIFTVQPQEGDGNLYIQSLKNDDLRMTIPRGNRAVITEDSRYVVFRISPKFEDTREAKIKKKKPDEMPKDSMGIVSLSDFNIHKFSGVKSFKTPEDGFGWLAYQTESVIKKKPKETRVPKAVDSLKQTIDSLNTVIENLQKKKKGKKDDDSQFDFAEDDEKGSKGTDVVLRNLTDGKEVRFLHAGSYEFDKSGNQIVLALSKNPEDSNSSASVILYEIGSDKTDTLLKGGKEFKNFTFSEKGEALSFVADRDTATKPLQKFYDLYLYRKGDNTAKMIVDRSNSGMPEKSMVSQNGNLKFSKDGQRLFFGTAPIPLQKDTSLKEIDEVKLDIWNYKDDYLQPQQLARLRQEQNRNYLAVYDLSSGNMRQLGSVGLPVIMTTPEGNGNFFIGVTDTGRRVATQWQGFAFQDIYAVNPVNGKQTLIKKNLHGRVYPSPSGRVILFYDTEARNYFSWDGNKLKNVTSLIKVPLFDEQNDVPELPSPYGVMGWTGGDSAVFIYDRYDVWKVDPTGMVAPIKITPDGRNAKLVYRFLPTDREEKYLTSGKPAYFSVFNDVSKGSSLAKSSLANKLSFTTISSGPYKFGRPVLQKNGDVILYTKENYVMSPDLYANGIEEGETKLSDINPQQSEYNWGTAELYNWKTFDGKSSTGILYKPEDFDSSKKYPVIFYFYERLSDGLYSYNPPAPTPSRLNISFFVSRGYLVFAPDIRYTIGHPGKSAYNYIVSAAQDLAKRKWVDGKNMGIQGQSWGGYQVAYLITATNMFKAAWSGAPVANMFSAYGGIRWESGMNRQFQYEKTQSRIGSTIWERPDLYTENSPLFHLQKVKTPVVIMSNDADGAVPWYQGIEMFTALRRLGKKVWLLNYNGEAHNLVQRKNRKDISIREQQFFDWLLKGAEAPEWITKGVPAINKGIDWGLEY